MRKFFIAAFLLLFLTSVVVYASYSMEISVSVGSYQDVYLYVNGSVTITLVMSSSNVDYDMYVYLDSNSNYCEEGPAIGSDYYSNNGTGRNDTVSFSYTGYVRVDVYHYSGDGSTTLYVDGDATIVSANEARSSCTTTTTTPPPSGGGGSESSSACPAGCNPPFPCSCPIFNWDPCAGLASIYCAFKGFVNAVTGFFSSIVDGIRNFVNGVVNVFTSVGEGIVNFFRNLANGIVNGLRSIGEFLASIPRGIAEALSSFVGGIADSLASMFEGLGQNEVAQWIRDNGIIAVGIILILVGLVFRPVMFVGILLVIFGMIQHGFRIEYMLIIFGLLILLFIVKR